MSELEIPSNRETKLVTGRSAIAALIMGLLTFGLGYIYAGRLRRALFANVILYVSLIGALLVSLLLNSVIGLLLTFLTAGLFEILVLADTVRIARKCTNYKLKPYNKWYYYVLFVIIIALSLSYVYEPILKNCLLTASRSMTGSMEYTILAGDYLFVDNTSYGIHNPFGTDYIFRTSKPERNDLIVFLFPGNRDEIRPKDKANWVKRVIGIPGDIIEIKNDVLFVNSVEIPLPEFSRGINYEYDTSNHDPRIFPKNSGLNEAFYGPLSVPARNDIVKLDVSNFDQWQTFICREGHTAEIRDSVVYIDQKPSREYKVENNYYFVLGDFRHNSLDSRYFGFVEENNISGKAIAVYFSYSEDDRANPIRWDRIGKKIK